MGWPPFNSQCNNQLCYQAYHSSKEDTLRNATLTSHQVDWNRGLFRRQKASTSPKRQPVSFHQELGYQRLFALHYFKGLVTWFGGVHYWFLDSHPIIQFTSWHRPCPHHLRPVLNFHSIATEKASFDFSSLLLSVLLIPLSRVSCLPSPPTFDRRQVPGVIDNCSFYIFAT